jgi:hypothetical protein
VTVRTSVVGTSFDGLVINGLTASGVGSAGATVVAWSASASTQKLTGIDLSAMNLSGGVVDGIDTLTAGVVAFAAGNGSDRLSDLGTSTVTKTLTAAPAQKLVLGGNTTITLPAATGTGVRHSFEVTLQQDATGSRTVTWPSSVKWAGGSAPTLTVTAHHADTIRLFDDGVVWCGSVVAANWAGPSVADAAVIAATANGPGAVRLTWAAPNDNGSAITDYVVQYRTTSGPGTWTTYSHTASTATAIVVAGLTNATSYDFQIAAVNLVGQAAFSNAPSATPVLGYNPLTSITWAAAYWAADPSWTFPGDGSQVSSWRDGSGNSRTLTQPVTSARNPLLQDVGVGAEQPVRFGVGRQRRRAVHAVVLAGAAVQCRGDPRRPRCWCWRAAAVGLCGQRSDVLDDGLQHDRGHRRHVRGRELGRQVAGGRVQRCQQRGIIGAASTALTGRRQRHRGWPHGRGARRPLALRRVQARVPGHLRGRHPRRRRLRRAEDLGQHALRGDHLMIFAGPTSTFTCSASNFATGLTGTMGVQIINASGTVIKSRTTSGIVEGVATSGFYIATINLGSLSAAPAPGHYYVFWDNGAVTVGNTSPRRICTSAARRR